MKKNRKIKLPEFKKDIKDFFLSEDGKISNKNIVALGASLVLLGMAVDYAEAGHSNWNEQNTIHCNGFFFTDTGGHCSSPQTGAHCSYNDHYNNNGHSSWGGGVCAPGAGAINPTCPTCL